MKLSVVILNYNVQYFLELCLKSVIEAIQNIEAEIIVVDNNSEDNSCEMIRKTFPEVILIENKENLGFSKGNNIGVAKSKGEYVCILNPDTVVPEDIFEKLLTFSDTKSKLGIVGCKLINGRGEFLPESKRNIPFVKAAFKKIIGNSNDYYANDLRDNEIGTVAVLVGAFMIMKKEIYLEANGFDEDYFMYGEDIDLSYRVLKAGYNNFYYGLSTVIHFKGESTLRDKQYAKRFYGAMQIFYKKHFKKNILFNFLIGLSIKVVYLFRKGSVVNKKTIDRYFLVSDKMNKNLQKVLRQKVILKLNLMEKIPDNTEIILDSNVFSFKESIALLENTKKNDLVTFKILPKESNFIIGSDNAVSRGEIIHL